MGQNAMARVAAGTDGGYDQSLLEHSVFVNILGIPLLDLVMGDVRGPLYGLSFSVALSAHL